MRTRRSFLDQDKVVKYKGSTIYGTIGLADKLLTSQTYFSNFFFNCATFFPSKLVFSNSFLQTLKNWRTRGELIEGGSEKEEEKKEQNMSKIMKKMKEEGDRGITFQILLQ